MTHVPRTRWAGAVAGALVLAGACRADTAVLTPSADATISFNANDPASARSNGAGPGLFVGRTYVHADYRLRALLRFDLGALPCNAVVTGATLRLRMERSPSIDLAPEIGLHRLTAPWSEGPTEAFGGQGEPSMDGDCNWYQRRRPDLVWSTPGGDFDAAASGTAASDTRQTEVVFESTPQMVADVRGWVAEPGTNSGWLLLGDESRSGTARRFSSRESADASARPSLIISYSVCVADFDCSGSVGVQDLFDFLQSFFGGETRADVNASGAVSVQDIFDFLAAFFAGCPG